MLKKIPMDMKMYITNVGTSTGEFQIAVTSRIAIAIQGAAPAMHPKVNGDHFVSSVF